MASHDATQYYAVVRQALWEALIEYDRSTLARWWAWLNHWQWPADCPIPQPVGWETTQLFVKQTEPVIPQDTPNRAVLMAPLWDVLLSLTTEADRHAAPLPPGEPIPPGMVRLTNSGRLYIEAEVRHG